MKIWASLVLVLSVCSAGFGYTLSPRNQLALLGIKYLSEGEAQAQLWALWQPELNASLDVKDDFSLAGQFTGSATGKYDLQAGEDDSDLSAKIYRLWLKGGTPQTDVRIGLQRLNFGPAQLLRPLQWFDTLDPTDKLEQTEGVQALLLRHYFLNNANVWLWGIRGEGKTRGLTLTQTKEDTPELGGRFQYPLPHGEIALTANHRFDTGFKAGNLEYETGRETRIGLDARFDLEVGLWAEGYVSYLEDSQTYYPVGEELVPLTIMDKYQAPLTLGVDYTFELGNGIYALAETQFNFAADEDWADLHRDNISFAVSANYPLNILDKIIYYGLAGDDNTLSHHTLLWRRDYDRLSWDLAAFWDAGTGHDKYDSRGLRLMLSYTF